MGLYLTEVATGAAERPEVDALLHRLDTAVVEAGAELVESRVTSDLKRLFAVVEAQDDDPSRLAERLRQADIPVDDVAPVRLVGAELGDVRAQADSTPGYLVEWDLPPDLTMDAYLARKRAKAPRYAEVPEVSFRRTYVREDLEKCLCFYDAPCADDVYRAREAVEAPVDRFHELS